MSFIGIKAKLRHQTQIVAFHIFELLQKFFFAELHHIQLAQQLLIVVGQLLRVQSFVLQIIFQFSLSVDPH